MRRPELYVTGKIPAVSRDGSSSIAGGILWGFFVSFIFYTGEKYSLSRLV